MLSLLFLKLLGDKERDKKIKRKVDRLDASEYVRCSEFLKNKISYYKENDFRKGCAESVSWVKYYTHYTHLGGRKQSQIDNLAVELITLTCNQDDVYKVYKRTDKFSLSCSIAKFVLDKRSELSNSERLKAYNAQATNFEANHLSGIAQYKLDQAIKKEEEIKQINEREKRIMENLTPEKLAKVNAEGVPTINELMLQGSLTGKSMRNVRISCNVYAKIYKYYYVVVGCPVRKELTGETFKFVKFENREDAIEACSKLFSEEIGLVMNYQQKQKEKQEKKQQQRNNTSVDISNVTRAMGLENDGNDLDGDIFN